ncbi:S8 family serine peptidase [Salinimicrobium sp. MT39]|uniref:S8 family serine peptidase n=1 Tax=Salinimicrobium profundisediminis TaxID=2994553 RepID=A0A9X3CU15_9FLAO|nr:S8 family serine peptidase [Salinimicrobium profundisediminis]MCX2836684.1 S8 family serine peptidase [Salinimicrobium profundisediminis]
MNFKKYYSGFAAALALTAMVSCSQEETTNLPTQEEPQTAQSYSEVIPGQYIVVYRENGKMKGDHRLNSLQIQQKTQEVLSVNAVDGAEIVQVYSAAISGVALKMSKDAALKLSKSKDVAYVEQDRIVALAPPCGTPNGGPCDDPGDGGGDDGGTSAQETPYGISRVNGGVTYTGSGVAWVIDTGIDLDHEDLNVDVSRGYNAFTSGKDGQSLDDGNGHGSHVAGTIAAIDNNVGVIGVAAGATVIPVKVLDSRGSGSYSGVVAGVNHVAANGKPGDVANMSLGGPISQALDDAVLAAAQAGIKFALAAGNEGTDANDSSPARVNHSNVVTISAINSSDTFASFSNWGNPPVDYAAPGVSIKSTWKGGGYNTISGTSMAAPHTAGVWLLGNISTSGYASGDPDGDADPISVH